MVPGKSRSDHDEYAARSSCMFDAGRQDLELPRRGPDMTYVLGASGHLLRFLENYHKAFSNLAGRYAPGVGGKQPR
jgi:hypothetical protein